MVMEALKTAVDARPVISADRFLALLETPEYSERNVELIKGEIVELPLNNLQQGEVLAIFGAKLYIYVEEKGLGLLGIGGGFVLERRPDDRDTVRGIGLFFLSKAKAPSPLTIRESELAPDLAVEVLSPSNTAMDMNLKVKQLLQAGTELVWIVDPENHTVLVHSNNSIEQLGLEDMLTGGAVLPGFEIPVADIFPV